MRRLCLLAALLAGAAAAPAQTIIPTSPGLLDRGSRVVDVRSKGARPATDPLQNRAANTAAIQAALDSLANGPGTVYIPAGDWFIDDPIFLDGPIGLRGEPGAVLWGNSGKDVLVAGLPRKPQGRALSRGRFVDLFGVLDATAAPAAGQLYGVRYGGDTHLAQQGGPWDTALGQGYAEVRAVTVDFAWDFTHAREVAGSKFPTQGPVFGINDSSRANPFTSFFAGGQLAFVFATIDPASPPFPLDPPNTRPDYGTRRDFRFGDCSRLTALHRVTMQCDLDAGRFNAWIDGTRVASQSFPPGQAFVPNQNAPFGVGAANVLATATDDDIPPAIDVTVCGFRVSKAALYLDQATQARVDGRPITDRLSYFTDDAQNLGYLYLAGDPAKAAASRAMSVIGNGKWSTVYLMDRQTGSPFSFTGPGPIEDLVVRTGAPGYGRALTTSGTGALTARRCSFLGGWHGVGATNGGVNYPAFFDDCTFAGADAGAYFWNATGVVMRNVNLRQPGRVGFRLVRSFVRIDNLFVPGVGKPDCIVRGEASSYDIDHALVDYEDPVVCPTWMFYASGAGFASPLDSRVRLHDIEANNITAGGSFVFLDDRIVEDGGQGRHLSFSGDQLAFGQASRGGAVRTTGLRWVGEVKAETSFPRENWIVTDSGQGGVVSRHASFRSPPRDGRWEKNGSILTVRRPAPGQYAEWRCASPGEYGTPTPPGWQGFAVADPGDTGLAAYVHDQSYVAAGPGAGSWSNFIQATVVDSLFRGTAYTPPTQLYAALTTVAPDRAGNLRGEVGVLGYARVPIPANAWQAAGDGVVALNADLVFPGATAAWNVRGLVIASAATRGYALASCDLAGLSGPGTASPKVAAGTVRIGRVGRPARGKLGILAPAVADEARDNILAGRPLVPRTVTVALSTGRASDAIAEPAGGGYARVATVAADWAKSPGNRYTGANANNPQYDCAGPTETLGATSNARVFAFPQPTASWGQVRSVFLLDAAGAPIGSADLVTPCSPAPALDAPAFAAGALWVTRS